MTKPITALSDLKVAAMLGVLVIIPCSIRFIVEITVPFILTLFITVILNPPV